MRTHHTCAFCLERKELKEFYVRKSGIANGHCKICRTARRHAKRRMIALAKAEKYIKIVDTKIVKTSLLRGNI